MEKLTNENGILSKKVRNVTLNIQQGYNLGITMVDFERNHIMTMQLDHDEKKTLIKYLQEND